MFTQKSFGLTDREFNAIRDWANTHECSCKGNTKPRSCCCGEVSVTFTPTTINIFISAKCVCGKTIVIR